MRRVSRTGFIAIAAASAVVIGGGVAFAYWTTNGGGSSSVTVVGGTTGVTVTQTGSVTGLYPGGPAQPISIHIVNPNASDVTLAKVVATVFDTTDAGCTSADFVITGNAYNGGVVTGTPTAPNNFVNASTATIKMIDTGQNQDLCKGVTVNLNFTAS